MSKRFQNPSVRRPSGSRATKVKASLQNALALHRRGRLAEAEQIYRKILKVLPNNFDANHLLGVALMQRRQLAEGEQLLAKAIELKPNDPSVLNNRGNALKGLGLFDEALGSYDKAIALKPDYAEAFSNRGLALHELARFDEALASYDKAIALKPDYAEAFSNRGNSLQKLKCLNEALASYDAAIALKPDFAEAFNNRGLALKDLKSLGEALASYDKAITLKPDYAEAFSNRGNLLQELQRFDDALASYDKAIALKPDYAEAFSNRGMALKALNRLDESLASYDRAIALKPDYAEAFSNRGNSQQELNRFDEALASYDRAIALKADYAEALNNRGITLRELSRFDEALASYDRAIVLKPDYAYGHKNRAHCRLLIGGYQEGWSDYEWRWQTKEFASRRPNIKVSTWQGEALSGRHLLVFSEQGMGDAIQFARYLPLLAERGCKVTFAAPAKLVRLLRPSLQPVEIVSELSDLRGVDFQVALMSLPHRFNTELTSIPSKVPYLRAEPELEARWKARLGERGFKIGIAWQGNPGSRIDEGRSIALKEFVPLSRISGVRLISLQKHAGLDQLADLPKDIEIETLGEDFDNGPDAFIDTAAVMNGLDLIITSDTSIAHLAGALGRPTWVALRHVPDWRWLLDREDCPWYPTLRLFRQPQRDDWASVFSNIERKLHVLLNAKVI